MGKKGKMPDMNLPIWFDGQNINEALFCEEFCGSAESSSQTELFSRPMVG